MAVAKVNNRYTKVVDTLTLFNWCWQECTIHRNPGVGLMSSFSLLCWCDPNCTPSHMPYLSDILSPWQANRWQTYLLQGFASTFLWLQEQSQFSGVPSFGKHLTQNNQFLPWTKVEECQTSEVKGTKACTGWPPVCTDILHWDPCLAVLINCEDIRVLCLEKDILGWVEPPK